MSKKAFDKASVFSESLFRCCGTAADAPLGLACLYIDSHPDVTLGSRNLARHRCAPIAAAPVFSQTVSLADSIYL